MSATTTNSFDAFGVSPSAGFAQPQQQYAQTASQPRYGMRTDPFVRQPQQTQSTAVTPFYAPVSTPTTHAPPAPTHNTPRNAGFASPPPPQPSVVAPTASHDEDEHETTSVSSVPDDVIRAQQAAYARFQKNVGSQQQRARSVTPPRGTLVSYDAHRSRAHVPRSRNPAGSDAVHPARKQMKQERKVKTAAGAASGVVVGTLIAGPVGLVLGGPIGGYAANKISKNGERRAQRKHEQKNFQRAAAKSAAARNGSFA